MLVFSTVPPRHVPELHTLPAFAGVKAAFAPLEPNAGRFPPGIREAVRDLEKWNDESARAIAKLPSSWPVSRLVSFERIFSRGLALLRTTDTAAISSWMNAAGTDPALVQEFKRKRVAFAERYDSLVRLLGEIGAAAEITRPSVAGTATAMRDNSRKLAQLVGARHPVSVIGVWFGLGIVVFHERGFLRSVIGRLIRTSTRLPFRRSNQRLADRVNAMLGWTAVDYTRAEDLRVAYRELSRKGVRGERADALVRQALETSRNASGRAWKGLLRLRELVVHADLDPKSAEFESRLDASMNDAVFFTHCPGSEVLVRDYKLGLELAIADGKVDPTTGHAALTQGGSSIAPGIFRQSAESIETGRKYIEPLDMFMSSMVTADGEDHKTQKRIFARRFGWGAVLETTPYVEQTLSELIDRAIAKAADNGGRFDFKMDFAFHFPIRIICHVLGAPAADSERLQELAERYVRTLDLGTGMSPAKLTDGNLAAQELKSYFGAMIQKARMSAEIGGIIGDLAKQQLPVTDEVLIANLVVLLFAGFETTTGLLSMGVNELLQRPEQWAHLRSVLVQGGPLELDGEVVPDRDLRWSSWAENQAAGLEPEAAARLASITAKLVKSPELAERRTRLKEQERELETAVEEMLRFTAPGSVIPLAVKEDYELAIQEPMTIDGRAYEPGDVLTLERGLMVHVAVDELNRRCPFGGGQFDVGATGDFDITRKENKTHLSFGRAHSCIGARLAIENMKRALEAVLRRMPDLQLDGKPAPQEFDLFNGLANLPVRIPR